jgi:hypothetical protein
MHRRVDGVQTPRHRADDGVASMAYSTQEVTDRWKTGDITWYGDYIDDKSCGTGKYGLPEKEVEENDSGEGTKTRYEHRRSVCLCEDAEADPSYDTADLLATSPGLPSGSAALPCDDMLVSSEDKYDKTTSAEAFAIVFIVLICVEIKFTARSSTSTVLRRWRGDVGSSPLNGASAAT